MHPIEAQCNASIVVWRNLLKKWKGPYVHIPFDYSLQLNPHISLSGIQAISYVTAQNCTQNIPTYLNIIEVLKINQNNFCLGFIMELCFNATMKTKALNLTRPAQMGATTSPWLCILLIRLCIHWLKPLQNHFFCFEVTRSLSQTIIIQAFLILY